MNTTDNNLQDNALNNSTNYGNTVPNQPDNTVNPGSKKDYDTGADTDRSEHDIAENKINDYKDRDDDQDFVVVGRFNSSSRYDSGLNGSAGQYFDEEDDW